MQVVSRKVEVLAGLGLHVGKSDAVAAKIKLSVELSDEDITKDPERSSRRRDVHPNEPADAQGLTKLTDLTDQQTKIWISWSHL